MVFCVFFPFLLHMPVIFAGLFLLAGFPFSQLAFSVFLFLSVRHFHLHYIIHFLCFHAILCYYFISSLLFFLLFSLPDDIALSPLAFAWCLSPRRRRWCFRCAAWCQQNEVPEDYARSARGARTRAATEDALCPFRRVAAPRDADVAAVCRYSALILFSVSRHAARCAPNKERWCASDICLCRVAPCWWLFFRPPLTLHLFLMRDAALLSLFSFFRPSRAQNERHDAHISAHEVAIHAVMPVVTVCYVITPSAISTFHFIFHIHIATPFVACLLFAY